ncbi:predicted protein [Arabidopsis lyrata subsp. lyrata]|uniref:Predicted protein n=1 Tax=Arabidopsis lyrata subsp. lyrata TaxID=81972 RepID=D7LZL3_ARALL|nr:putative cysteine-rich receptor-like protein kinase 32 [Arabidopsis lyrata subsp. lyrata]EFH48854.1 predicted protein [Arabidopsis lyrata subsp. lyrata]|eukprot:XP_002872595.1 putative cysteine-rich receptor-like protein kinase 32 [Arabidopsis lyrata subsp. lyrata]
MAIKYLGVNRFFHNRLDAQKLYQETGSLISASFCSVSAQFCGKSLFFTPNGTYDTNRRLVLSTLASNVSSRDGYYNVSVGEGPERIYALGLCIPGSDPKLCSDCIQPVSLALLQNCPNQTDSYQWGIKTMLCLVRYSNHSFFNSLNLQPVLKLCSPMNITGNVTEFNRIWANFMEDMITTLAASTSYERRHYAAKASHPIGLQRIYALMQCIPGVSVVDCESCLRQSVLKSLENCSGRKGSKIRRPTCFFRWEFYSYYGAFVDTDSSPPPNPQGPQFLPPNATENAIDGTNMSTRTILVIVAPAAIIVVLLALGFAYWKRIKSFKQMKLKPDDDITNSQPLRYDLKTIEAATNNFSGNNKLGEGGFGVVYKGTFPDGTEIAVKRLSITSRQGLQEFTNEVNVLLKLQHNNLVELLGYCLEGEEKILVYEFLSNKSLDVFLFDTMNQRQLDWTKRYNIIEGIARGILYLHRDSRHKIIHRDLKVSNILLDADMNPKIADFGLAKIFAMEQTRAETSKIAGTYGYMAPEYRMHGQFSMESDIYSFGVLVLEIINGKTCSSIYQTDGTSCNLVTYAWRLWRKGLALELMDSTFEEDYQSEKVDRCIHIALLCVQENPADRPNLSTIISMLTSSQITLSIPNKPGFYVHSRRLEAEGLKLFGTNSSLSINDDVSVTLV